MRQNPRNIFAWRNKGMYYYMQGDKTSALKYLGDALERNPELPLAREYYEKALEL
ncbi:tetratricopeptide repeat protein [Nitritalea halalkaliphila]|uniref:tetratricopeptide repeat protein n=1 Tax=Nitritalea halalkaliphila TaxID=590849 RepID=UPI00030676C2|nr:tetratricopeptide repeat protein [Nitritalea halalkaliphila]